MACRTVRAGPPQSGRQVHRAKGYVRDEATTHRGSVIWSEHSWNSDQARSRRPHRQHGVDRRALPAVRRKQTRRRGDERRAVHLVARCGDARRRQLPLPRLGEDRHRRVGAELARRVRGRPRARCRCRDLAELRAARDRRGGVACCRGRPSLLRCRPVACRSSPTTSSSVGRGLRVPWSWTLTVAAGRRSCPSVLPSCTHRRRGLTWQLGDHAGRVKSLPAIRTAMLVEVHPYGRCAVYDVGLWTLRPLDTLDIGSRHAQDSRVDLGRDGSRFFLRIRIRPRPRSSTSAPTS